MLCVHCAVWIGVIKDDGHVYCMKGWLVWPVMMDALDPFHLTMTIVPKLIENAKNFFSDEILNYHLH